MRQVPMIFNTEMVKALLANIKLATRRPVKSLAKNMQALGHSCIQHREPGDKWYGDRVWSMRTSSGGWADYTHNEFMKKAPCQVGDLIWVRETFATLALGTYEPEKPHLHGGLQDVRYKASELPAVANQPDWEVRGYKWRPSIHMPKWASRLTLKVTDVRIEQMKVLRKDSDQIRKEGFENWPQFKHVWQSIYGSCKPDDWVWVIEFDVIQANVEDVSRREQEAAEIMGIQVLNYKEGREFECFYQNYEFTLSRDPNDGYSFANWYMIVKDEEGETCCDGWIDDSSNMGVRSAFESACASAELEPPSEWPELN